jgi:hypothetical protein
MGFWILEFGFKVFCPFNEKTIEQSDTTNPQSKIPNLKLSQKSDLKE